VVFHSHTVCTNYYRDVLTLNLTNMVKKMVTSKKREKNELKNNNKTGYRKGNCKEEKF
jgi:hypothetical protein